MKGDGDGVRKNEGGLGGSGEDYLLDPAVEISLRMLLAHLLINKHQVTQFTDLIGLNSVHKIYVHLLKKTGLFNVIFTESRQSINLIMYVHVEPAVINENLNPRRDFK